MKISLQAYFLVTVWTNIPLGMLHSVFFHGASMDF